MTKLTKEFVEQQIEFTHTGQRFYRCSETPGFAVRTTKKNKSYIFEKRVGGKNRRDTFGKCSEISFEQARKEARIMLGEIESGNDPRTGKRISSERNVTLQQAFDKLLELKRIRESTRRSYISSMQHLED